MVSHRVVTCIDHATVSIPIKENLPSGPEKVNDPVSGVGKYKKFLD